MDAEEAGKGREREGRTRTDLGKRLAGAGTTTEAEGELACLHGKLVVELASYEETLGAEYIWLRVILSK
jgi:hypothetical protein